MHAVQVAAQTRLPRLGEAQPCQTNGEGARDRREHLFRVHYRIEELVAEEHTHNSRAAAAQVRDPEVVEHYEQ